MTGTSASPICFAASSRPCPAISRPSGSVSSGLVNPNAWMDCDDLLDLSLGVRARIARIGHETRGRPVGDRKRAGDRRIGRKRCAVHVIPLAQCSRKNPVPVPGIHRQLLRPWF